MSDKPRLRNTIIIPLTEHMESLIGNGIQNVWVAMALSTFRHALEQPEYAYLEYEDHYWDYVEKVMRNRTETQDEVVIYLGIGSTRDIHLIGSQLDTPNMLNGRLEGPVGYKRYVVVYLALRWFADHPPID
jgi:hypothetical protein